MPTDPQSGVDLIGEPLPYLDQAEDRLIEIVREAGDRSTGSDELATHIVDWPSRYHLSRLRTNLLRPLQIRPGARVLDIGAGTGVLTRFLGEAGADVVALEGSLERARVAQARCAGLEHVRVVCGALSAFEDPDGFDLVLLCGVLEYSATDLGGGQGPGPMLESAARLTRPTGAIVLAIENQLGLKYLVGHAEDHLGRPWVGVEGYGRSTGVRTWTRRELGDLLGGAGFTEQRWAYPFPDYKLPTTVVADRAYDEPDVARFLDQLLKNPTRIDDDAPALHADARRIHRVALEAGIGREVANSFLVVASADGTAPDVLLDRDVLAWRYGDERRRLWLRSTTVRVAGDRRLAHQARLYPAEGRPESGWLAQSVTAERSYHRGSTLEQQFLTAADKRDEAAMASALTRWRELLRGQERARDERRSVHPFLPDESDRVLPPSWLDVSLDNFVEEDGDLHFIDDEWVAPEGICPDLVIARSLWWLARSMVVNDVDHPWSSTVDVDGLAISLGRLAGEAIDRDRLEAFRAAEADFQALVGGGDRDEQLAGLVALGRTSSFELGLRGDHLVGALSRLERELRELQAAHLHVAAQSQHIEDLEAKARLVDEMAHKLHEARVEREFVHRQHEDLVQTLDRIRRRLPVRLFLKLRRIMQGDG